MQASAGEELGPLEPMGCSPARSLAAHNLLVYFDRQEPFLFADV